MRYITFFLILVFFTSCFLMPLGAPHHHKYIAITQNEFVNVVEVFDTPKHKTYHFFAKKGLKVKEVVQMFLLIVAILLVIMTFLKKKNIKKQLG